MKRKVKVYAVYDTMYTSYTYDIRVKRWEIEWEFTPDLADIPISHEVICDQTTWCDQSTSTPTVHTEWGKKRKWKKKREEKGMKGEKRRKWKKKRIGKEMKEEKRRKRHERR